MYGNAEEWCSNPYVRYSLTAESKPAAVGILKVLRGGNWMNPASRCTSSARSAAPAKERRRGAGFRLAASKPSQPEPPTETVVAASTPQQAAVDPDLLDEAVESLSTQYRDASQSYLRSRYRFQLSQLSLVIGYTRLTEGRSAEALASFRRILVAWIQATCAPELKMVYDPAAATEAALAAMSQTVFKEWLPYAVLAAAHAESGDFDKAVLRAQQALDQAPAEVRDECRARMETYKSRRTSRGARPPISFRKMP
jgi:tetratricopeptide (TPR) repeat protein